MRSTPLENKIATLARPVAEDLGLEIVCVKILGEGGGTNVQVMAENPQTHNLGVEDCTKLSKALSALLDVEDPISGTYRLEVSSPGIDRPLTRPKDFASWAGHEARVMLLSPVDGNRKTVQGMLTGIEGDTVSLDDRKSGPVQFAFADIHSAKLVLTDRLIAATRPLDTSGADELLEEQED